MIYGHNDADKFVYHYTGAEIARDYILKSWTLRLNTLAATNDPRESKSWDFSFWSSGKHDVGSIDTQQVSEWFSTVLKSRARIACFVRDQTPLTGDHSKDILLRGLARARMWAQYADRHRGVCLVFDRARLIEAVAEHLAPRLCYVGNVSYKDRSAVPSLTPNEFMINVDQLIALGPERYALAHIMQYHDQLYFEKLSDWRDEVEWRILALGQDEGPLLLPIERVLVGVIHGASIDPYISDALIAQTQERSIEHMGLVWRNSSPWYGIGETRWSASDRALLGWKPRE